MKIIKLFRYLLIDFLLSIEVAIGFVFFIICFLVSLFTDSLFFKNAFAYWWKNYQLRNDANEKLRDKLFFKKTLGVCLIIYALIVGIKSENLTGSLVCYPVLKSFCLFILGMFFIIYYGRQNESTRHTS